MHSPGCEACGSGREENFRRDAVPHSADLIANVRRFGYGKIHVPEEPGFGSAFTYSVGIWHTLSAPEIIVSGLDLDVSYPLVDSYYALVESGRRFVAGDSSDEFLDRYPVQFVTFAQGNYEEHLGQAQMFYGTDSFPVLMMVWPAADGSLPWDIGAPSWLLKRQSKLWIE